jgi:hypothetical protein
MINALAMRAFGTKGEAKATGAEAAEAAGAAAAKGEAEGEFVFDIFLLKYFGIKIKK